MRSLLLTPVINAQALETAHGSGADALILDLVTDEGASSAATRQLALGFLQSARLEQHGPMIYVRLPSIDAETIQDDLAAVMPGEPDGFVLGRCRSGTEVQHLGAKLAVHEAEIGFEDGDIAVIAEAGADAQSLFGLGGYGACSPRLMALSWHAPSLALDVGCEATEDLAGPVGPLQTARSMILFAARAADVAAFDGPSFTTDDAMFHAECVAARRDGFNGKIATTPAQVAIINAVFDRAV